MKMMRLTRMWLAGLLVPAGLAAAGAQPPARPAAPRPTEPIPREGCVTAECHTAVIATPYVHGPVSVGACDACHESVDPRAHTFRLTRADREMCGFCHQIELTGRNVHQPVSTGECAGCHDPHGGSNQFMLRGGGGAASCAECHVDVTEGLPMVHGPVAAGACTACHAPHASDHAFLLRKPGREMCLECHATLQRELAGARTVHEPVAGECTSCHRAHAATERMLLDKPAVDMCLSCHPDIAERVNTAKIKHSAVVTGRACQSCHAPHGSDFAALLLDDMVAACLTCHDREIEAPDGTTLPDFGSVLAEGKSLHGPIAQRNCVACHQVHGGTIFRLLTKEYPPDFYAPFEEANYAMCFECHSNEIVHDPNTDRLTDFRNGTQNLHYVHVNKKVKGRTCRACHETHASANPKHMRDEVPFGSGGWRLPIGYTKTENGGSCNSGCHRVYRYDRANPVNNLPAPRAAPPPASAPAVDPIAPPGAEDEEASS